MADKAVLLKKLEDLGEEGFKKFKWFLESPEIPKSYLENADRLKTVDKIVQTYNQRSLEVVKETLKKIKRNDLVETNISREAHDNSQTSDPTSLQSLDQLSLTADVKPTETKGDSMEEPPNCVLGAMDVKGELLKTLKKLGDEDFIVFKWLLSRTSEIPKSHLEKADRPNTVDKIVEACKKQSVEVVKKTLKEIDRNDLVEELSNITGSHDTNTPASQCNASSRYKDVISKCTKISSGPPAVYKLKKKKEKFGTLTRKTVGKKNLNKTNRTILLVGETGTGKSTLINALVNYAMGVKFEDNIWFQMVKEKKGQKVSKTSDVIIYEIFGYEGKTLSYSLTIIDTPGFGSTEGIKHDVIVSQKLLDLFRSPDGVHEINAVGLVLKASENRVSDRLKYIFDSVMSLFGKDMEKNIIALITHSDGVTPKNVLEALEAANIKWTKDEENETVHFLFNNNQNTQITKKNGVALETAWRTTETGMKRFTDFLEKSEPQRLNKTVEVLNERIRLTACIQNLQERIQLIEVKQRVIQQTEEALKKHEEEMKKNEKFTVEVEEVYKEKKDIKGGRRKLLFYKGAVTCKKCEENCHYPGCTMAWYPKDCEVIKKGYCTSCTNKCHVSYHVKDKGIYVTKTRKVQKTQQDMKKKYEENKSENEKKKSLMEHLQTEMKEQEAEKIKLLDEVYQHVEHLEQIAMNVDSLSTHVHLDFLIEKMKERRDTEKVKKLEEMKKRQDEGTRAGMAYMQLTVNKNENEVVEQDQPAE